MPPRSQHRAVQSVARKVLAEIAPTLSPLDTERTIADRACRLLADHGITETWYYGCMAYVLAGPRSCLSVSGKDYLPAETPIGPTSLVTIDLSPSQEGVWGDCARSYYIEQGVATDDPQLPEFINGRDALRTLHQILLSFATPDTTFEAMCKFMSEEVVRLEFETLDFLGNFGHSIESQLDQRSYIEPGNHRRLGDTHLFTFEPHIKPIEGTWGFKHEEIYYFDQDGRLQLL